MAEVPRKTRSVSGEDPGGDHLEKELWGKKKKGGHRGNREGNRCGSCVWRGALGERQRNFRTASKGKGSTGFISFGWLQFVVVMGSKRGENTEGEKYQNLWGFIVVKRKNKAEMQKA